MSAIIVDQEGSYLLIAEGTRFAVIERRNNHFYNCHGGTRHGTVTDDLSSISEIVDEADWVPEATARKAFTEAESRYAELTKILR